MNASTPLSAVRWVAAALPIAALLWLIVSNRLTPLRSALVAAAIAAFVGAVVFGAGPEVLSVAAGKGIWTGVWILYVIWPALLLFQLARRAGLADIGRHLASILPTEVENVLIVAWVLPSFIQGVAGFGTPIAVAAPLLLAMGISPVRAVVLPLVGYHWSVTFGSMGSSFYMGAFTAELGTSALDRYALLAALMLAVNAVVSGIVVAWLVGGWPGVLDARRMLVITGPLMGLTLVAMAQVEPSVATVSAGAVGLATVSLLHTRRQVRVGHGVVADQGERSWTWLRVLIPYGALIALVLPVLVPEPSRDFVRSHLLVGPTFGSTSTSLGVVNPAVVQHQAIAVLAHPGTYLLVATFIGWVFYRRLGLLAPGEVRPVLEAWIAQARRSSATVLVLTVLSAVLVDTGMVDMIARGAAAATGPLFVAISPLLGAIGSFTTGSTTTSNALFSALQADVGGHIGVERALLVAAQTAGGNVGNAVAPVVVLVGAGSIGVTERVGEIIRSVAPVAIALLVLVTALTAATSVVWV